MTSGAIMLLLLVSMPLALGSTVTRPAIWFTHQSILALLVAAWGFFWIKKDKTLPIHPIIILPFAMAGWSILQVLPLPPALLETIAPASDRLYHKALDSLFLYGNGQWRSISVAVPAGVSATIWLLLATSASLIASFIFAKRRLYRLLLITIAVVAIIMTFIGLAHMAMRENSLFGIISAPKLETFFRTTLINNNNAAAYLGMASLLLLGLSLHDSRRQFRLMYAAMSGLCGVGVMLTLSRGSIVIFILSIAILTGAFIKGLKARLAALLFLIAVISVSLYLASESLPHEMGNLADSTQISAKFDTWQDAITMIAATPLTGIGYGAYAAGVSYFSNGTGGVTRAIFPENIFLQLFGEFGLPFGLTIFLILTIFLMRTARRSQPSRTMAASAIALIYALLHDLSDFALMIPAIFLTWMIILGALNGNIHRQKELETRLPRVNSAALGIAMISLALLHFSLGSWAFANNQESVQLRLHKAVNNMQISEIDFEAEMKRCISLFPADYYLRMLASEHYRHKGWSSTAKRILHLKKAVELNRVSPLPRRMLGQAYFEIGDRNNARKEFTQALQFAFKDTGLLRTVSLAGFHGRELADMFPRNTEVLRHSTRILRTMGNNIAAAILYEECLPPNAGKDDLVLAANALISLGRIESAKKILEKIEINYPKASEPWQIKAAIYAKEKRYSDALQAYEKAASPGGGDSRLHLMAVEISLKAGDLEKAEQFLSKVRAHDRENLSVYFFLRGEMNRLKHKYQSALTDFSLASSHAPNNCSFLVKIADMNYALEHLDKAIEFYLKAADCAGGKKSQELRRKASGLKKKADISSND